MNRLILKEDWVILHNMKKFPEGLYRVIKVDIDITDHQPFILCKYETNIHVTIKFRDFETYVKQLFRHLQPKTCKIC